MDPFVDFMQGSPMAKAPMTGESLWVRLVCTAHDGMMEVEKSFPATQLSEFRDEHQRSVTHLAIIAGDLELLEFLLENGATLEDPDDCGASPLTTALLRRHFQAAEMLMTYGCDVDHVNLTLQTSMHVLATYGALDAVQWLLDRGADFEARDVGGNSPLHLAAAYCSLPVVELLLAAGADVNAWNALEATPLHFAAPNGNCVVVETLIKNGADLEARDERGNTPLIAATFVSQSAAPHFASGDQKTQYALVKVLLRHGANPNAVNNVGDTALFGAVHNEYDDVVKLLLAHGADARVRNNQQETLLHVLARGYTSNVSIWKELLQHQTDVFAQDRRNLTCAMVWAARHNISHTSNDGNSTPQQEIAWIERLLSNEAAVSSTSKQELVSQTIVNSV
ncbi:Serine/threonine-protein phosphatase 6 regulatory ankyrin repeat subunit B [Phytophthora citrophthora]|uniref:Serine/threonine-protein phosphatase 6 regulatory ankyrin repeat subunit B n=1 Tax=Phytophthora citrophthora TaxID=4793 RepID=A0AAD9G0L8_9STRA|nr:Serine/threonine-protein phosphatase 6 regulatory ankyrin repeat subunit B [Phytophthora citrophthora]